MYETIETGPQLRLVWRRLLSRNVQHQHFLLSIRALKVLWVQYCELFGQFFEVEKISILKLPSRTRLCCKDNM